MTTMLKSYTASNVTIIKHSYYAQIKNHQDPF